MHKTRAVHREYRRLRSRYYGRLEAIGLAVHNVESRSPLVAVCPECGRSRWVSAGPCACRSQEGMK